VLDLRRLCAQAGGADAADADGDRVITAADVGLALDALLRRPALVHCPDVLVRGGWFVVRGLFAPDRAATAVLGGRSLVLGTATPRELTFRVEAGHVAGPQELTVTADGRIVVARAVVVQ
jgi:hypothetical protein